MIPGVQASGEAATILARLQTLYPQLIDLSLGRIQRLLADLGRSRSSTLPPVIHVAGTNGKGSDLRLPTRHRPRPPAGASTSPPRPIWCG